MAGDDEVGANTSASDFGEVFVEIGGEMSPAAYEQLVEELCRDVTQGFLDPSQRERIRVPGLRDKMNDAGPATVRRQWRCKGRSGHDHIVDVAVDFAILGIRFLVIVECKKYRRSVGIEDVLEFASRLEDLAAHKGILVSTAGFQSGAVRLAASKGIALVRYQRFRVTIWSSVSQSVSPVYWLASTETMYEYETFSEVLLNVIAPGTPIATAEGAQNPPPAANG